ncbi:NAD(P)H-hydrate epimerase [Henriciella aquimarina]|uniref:NAD(P)H-hydrate epimerase n=1 Tax=Henriciella aquimarina TaxID=545261 RepID=UPI001302076F|nr:NAD(P)H-hydrate epimerase [Henriciella aquimarina]
MSHAIITPEQMYAAEKAVFDTGVSSFSAMQRAGRAVADHLHHVFPRGRVRILCGPGGNGGDGFIAAARLRALGRDLRVYLLGHPESLSGDPAHAAELWDDTIHPLEAALGLEADVTLDALFGGGLSRPLEGMPAKLAEEEAGPVVSVDVPSGLDGLTAKPLGPCFRSALTVTFAAYRPAHVLSPGRGLCGETRVEDIDIPVDGRVFTNAADLPERVLGETLPPPEEGVWVTSAGELEAFYPEIARPAENAIALARASAREAGRILVMRGPETLIASPDGHCCVDVQADPQACTDASLLERIEAAGQPDNLFAAACAAVWQSHG